MFLTECFTRGLSAERFCGNSYSKVTSVTSLCKIMQALGLIISHSFVAGVIAHDIGDSLENVFSPSSVIGMQCVCALPGVEQARCLSVRMFGKC